MYSILKLLVYCMLLFTLSSQLCKKKLSQYKWSVCWFLSQFGEDSSLQYANSILIFLCSQGCDVISVVSGWTVVAATRVTTNKDFLIFYQYVSRKWTEHCFESIDLWLLKGSTQAWQGWTVLTRRGSQCNHGTLHLSLHHPQQATKGMIIMEIRENSQYQAWKKL